MKPATRTAWLAAAFALACFVGVMLRQAISGGLGG
ncbi:hypothetical protein DFO50_12221 [Microvirgula sp. AG722]|nr:hypothetical protein DFO50_12221 [Microvirgula sp. AG722]